MLRPRGVGEGRAVEGVRRVVVPPLAVDIFPESLVVRHVVGEDPLRRSLRRAAVGERSSRAANSGWAVIIIPASLLC